MLKAAMFTKFTKIIISFWLLLISFGINANDNSDITITHKMNLSIVLPSFLSAAKAYINGEKDTNYAQNKYSNRILTILQNEKIDKVFLSKVIEKFSPSNKNWFNNIKNFYLPEDDYGDFLIKSASFTEGGGGKLNNSKLLLKNSVPSNSDDFDDFEKIKIALHAFKFEVINAYHDFYDDDIYCYFFITDGIIPSAKVTEIYKNNGSGDLFFFSEKDRIIFPITGDRAITPTNHLIVDFGIIDSMGDNIEDMKKMTGIILDLAMAVYGVYDPTTVTATTLIALRKEVKNLADAIINLNSDTKLVADSLYFKTNELSKIFAESTFNEIFKEYEGERIISSWHYRMGFRLLKGE